MYRSLLQNSSVLHHEIYSHLNQRNVRHLGLIFNLINYVLVTLQEDKPFKATLKYLATIKYCLKPF